MLVKKEHLYVSCPKKGNPFGLPLWCREGDLNPYLLAETSPSSWRVYLFRHLGVRKSNYTGPPGGRQAAPERVC